MKSTKSRYGQYRYDILPTWFLIMGISIHTLDFQSGVRTVASKSENTVKMQAKGDQRAETLRQRF